MRFEDCFFLGTVVSKYSFKGEVLLKLDTDDPDDYLDLDRILLDVDNSLVPYFIEKSSMHKPGLLRLRLEGVSSEEDADFILKSNAYLPLSLLPPLSGNAFYYHEVLGFLVKDKNLGDLGTVTGVNEQSAQAIVEVDINGKTALIPLVDDIILQVDRKRKTLLVTTPPGLIDLYL